MTSYDFNQAATISGATVSGDPRRSLSPSPCTAKKTWTAHHKRSCGSNVSQQTCSRSNQCTSHRHTRWSSNFGKSWGAVFLQSMKSTGLLPAFVVGRKPEVTELEDLSQQSLSEAFILNALILQSQPEGSLQIAALIRGSDILFHRQLHVLQQDVLALAQAQLLQQPAPTQHSLAARVSCTCSDASCL